METLETVQNNMTQIITDIARKLEGSKLAPLALKGVRAKNKKLAEYLGVTADQSYVFVVIFILQTKINVVELRDILKFLNLSFIDSVNLNSDIQALCNQNLIEVAGEFFTKRRTNRGLKSYNVFEYVINAIYENRPIVISEPEILDVYGFCNNVSDLVTEREMVSMETLELFCKVQIIESANPQLPFIERIKNMKIPLDERTLLYEMAHDLYVHGKSTSMMKTLEDMYDRPRERMCKMREFIQKTNILFQMELITSSESRFANDLQLDLTPEAVEMLFGDDAVLFSMAQKAKNVIKSWEIQEKQLFFEGKLRDEIDFLTKTLHQEQFIELKNRLEEQGLTPGINVLLYGHPGTGKTELCYQLSKQTGRDIVQVDLSQVRNMYFGESEKRVKEIFQNYRKLCDRSQLTPILLINEADGLLAKRRENSMRSTDQTENTIQNILLEEIERFKGILLCTTNLIRNFDNAFERRFLFKVKFEEPAASVKELIWKSKLNWLDTQLAHDLAVAFPFSGGQIDNIAKKVAIHKVLQGANPDRDQIFDFCKAETLQFKTSKIGYN